MLFVDAHCDTITRIMERKETLKKNSCHVDLERLKAAGSFVQFFAAFIEPVYNQAYALRWALQVIDRLNLEIESNKDDIMLCCNYSDVQEAIKNNKVAAVISIEDGSALQGELSALRALYKLGVRSICLTWNHRNEIADGVADGTSGGGLTPFGRQVVAEMNRLGMLIDVSHLSEKGFWDVLELSTQPVIASHSNAKSVCSHKRNLSDEQILALKKNNGVMGINFYPWFLNNSQKADINDIIRHIEHIISISGDDHVGIGADFDGIEITPYYIAGLQDVDKLFNKLATLNYKEKTIKKLAGENFMRVIKDVL
ncbi:MAG: dipeptidase [Clostridia bacterium]|nr:dipeptidase [Clostridia bacterium]